MYQDNTDDFKLHLSIFRSKFIRTKLNIENKKHKRIYTSNNKSTTTLNSEEKTVIDDSYNSNDKEILKFNKINTKYFTVEQSIYNTIINLYGNKNFGNQ